MKKVLFLLFILCLIGETALAAGTIKIGLMCPLTGSWASEGHEMKQKVPARKAVPGPAFDGHFCGTGDNELKPVVGFVENSL